MSRRLIDISLDAARKRLSSQTGWIHFSYESDGIQHDTIPLLENFCFVLALFRSRLGEDILQGKERLEKLLHFEVDGCFPIYLHEYPEIRDPGLAIEFLPIFLYLRKEYGAVLGEYLDSRLSSSIARIIAHAEKQTFQWSSGKRAKLDAAQGLYHLRPERIVHSSSQLADELIALQMQDDEQSKHYMASFFAFWHAGFDLYQGPYARELYEGTSPQPTLFDCFMESERIPLDHPLQMRTSLVYPLAKLPKEKTERDLYTWIDDLTSKSLHLFWGNKQELHSLTLQGATSWHTTQPGHYTIDFVLGVEPPKTGVEKCEVNLFMDYHPSHQILLDEKRGSSFPLVQRVTIVSTTLTMKLRFDVIEGKGEFYGHLLRGNRQRQVANRGENRFTAYDWQLALRTLSREPSCTVRMCLEIHPHAPTQEIDLLKDKSLSKNSGNNNAEPLIESCGPCCF